MISFLALLSQAGNRKIPVPFHILLQQDFNGAQSELHRRVNESTWWDVLTMFLVWGSNVLE